MSDRSEVRDRCSRSNCPSNQRSWWPQYCNPQPRGPCQLLWSCAPVSTCLGRSSRTLMATAAAFELGHELKEESVRQRVVGSIRGKKLCTAGVDARAKFAMAQHGQYTGGRGLFLRGKRAVFTLTLKPRMSGQCTGSNRSPPSSSARLFDYQPRSS